MTRLGLFISPLVLLLGTSSVLAQLDHSLRPLPRPSHNTAAAITADPSLNDNQGLSHSLRPILRPRQIEVQAKEKKRKQVAGSVCNDSAIQGQNIGSVAAKLTGCGVQHAVRVSSISGVQLSQKSVMDCPTARALKTWINKGARPAVGHKGGGLQGLKIAAHYSCRTRNNKVGAKISEHGKGRAIDISGFILKNGQRLTVLEDWHSANRNIMRQAHKRACGPFGTVLGPNADRYHQDHFHFDTARYRSGPYCR